MSVISVFNLLLLLLIHSNLVCLQCILYIPKVRNSTCPLARDKWIFRRTTKIANIVVRRTTWIVAGSVARQRSSYFGVRLFR